MDLPEVLYKVACLSSKPTAQSVRLLALHPYQYYSSKCVSYQSMIYTSDAVDVDVDLFFFYPISLSLLQTAYGRQLMCDISHFNGSF